MRLARRFAVMAPIVLCSINVGHAIPQLINYQGILTDGSGTPITVATAVEFRIWDMSVGGAELWMEPQLITPDANGRFSVLLGSVTLLADSILAIPEVYLGLTIAPDPEMTPRSQLVSVAYAFRTGTVDGATGGTITSKISIGPGHTNIGNNSFVAGMNSSVLSAWATVGGGNNNIVGDTGGTIGGGHQNLIDASSVYGTIGGGEANRVSEVGSRYSSIGGGTTNTARGIGATVGGGLFNDAGADGDSGAVISGGYFNLNNHSFSAVGGGALNSTTGDYGTIPGGLGNRAAALAFAAGRRAKADHNGSFVWGDDTDSDFATTAVDQFLVRAGGGVGIGTNSPAAGALAVDMASVHFGGASGYDFPMSDGASGEVLSTDGAGTLSWTALPGSSAQAGIASDKNAAAVGLTTTMQDIATTTITTTADGYIMVFGWTNFITQSTLSAVTCSAQIDETVGGSATAPYAAVVGRTSTGSSTGEGLHASVHRVYFKTAGSYTFRLEALKTGTPVVTASDGVITAVFYPASYGTVNP